MRGGLAWWAGCEWSVYMDDEGVEWLSFSKRKGYDSFSPCMRISRLSPRSFSEALDRWSSGCLAPFLLLARQSETWRALHAQWPASRLLSCLHSHDALLLQPIYATDSLLPRSYKHATAHVSASTTEEPHHNNHDRISRTWKSSGP